MILQQQINFIRPDLRIVETIPMIWAVLYMTAACMSNEACAVLLNTRVIAAKLRLATHLRVHVLGGLLYIGQMQCCWRTLSEERRTSINLEIERIYD